MKKLPKIGNFFNKYFHKYMHIFNIIVQKYILFKKKAMFGVLYFPKG